MAWAPIEPGAAQARVGGAGGRWVPAEPGEPGAGAQALGVLGAVGTALDYPRYKWAQLGYMLGGFSADEAAQAAETGAGLIQTLDPQFAREHPTATSVLGIGQEITADPVNLLLLGGLTKAGKLARGTKALATTWAKQAAAGQRSLVQVIYPTLKFSERIGRRELVFGAKTLIRGPRAVGALAAAGRGIAKPFAFLRTASANPLVRQVSAKALDAGANLDMQLLSVQDEIADIFRRVRPEDARQVLRAAEHIGRPGLQTQLLRGYAPEIVDLATQYKSAVDAFQFAAREAGVSRQFGGGLYDALDLAQKATGKEIARQEKHLARVLAGMGAQENALWKQTMNARKQAASWSMASVSLSDEELRIMQAPTFTRGKARVEARIVGANRRAAQYTATANRLDARVRRLIEARSGKRGAFKLSGARLEAAQQWEKQIAQGIEDMPNFMPHVLSQKGRVEVLKQGGRHRSVISRVWSLEGQQNLQRQFAERIYKTPKGKAVLRPWSIDEVDTFLKKPMTGTRAERYAEAMNQGGVLEWIESKVRKTPTELSPAERFFELHPTKALNRLRMQMVHAARGKGMWDAIQQMPDLLSKGTRLADGTLAGPAKWIHVKEISSAIAKRVGDAWVHPELALELTRSFDRAFNPVARNTFLRGFDKLTRMFKKTVTTPWPAYHWRNNISDLMLMTANGLYDPVAVFADGAKAVARSGRIWVGKHLTKNGWMAADELSRMARAYGVTFGELSEMGVKGILTAPENVRRMGYFADRLKAGYSPFQAALDVKKVLFDYRDLSTFERHYLRRVIPFWSWTRNSLRLQTEMMFKRPGWFMAQLRIGGQAKKLPEVPSWIRGRLMFGLGPDDMTGEEKVLTGIGLPIEDITEMLDFSGGYQDWVKQVGFRVNPLLKLGAYIPTGYDVERAEVVDRPRTAPSIVGGLPESVKRMMDVRQQKNRKGETYYTWHPRWDIYFRNTFARMYTTTKWAARPGKSLQEKLVQFFTGYGVTTFDPKQEARRRKEQERQSVLKAARLRGDIGIMGIPYRRRGGEMSRAEFRRLQRR